MYLLLTVVFGLCVGSFINAFVWRYHYNQKIKIPKNKLSILNGRSLCPKCRHKLWPFDLIPVLSWIFLRGKCRYCKESISIQYPTVELLTTLIFGLSYLFWKFNSNYLNIFLFICWLLILTGLLSLTIYDVKWKILPSKIIYTTGIFVIIYILLKLFYKNDFNVLGESLIGFLILGGLFYILFQYSKGLWIGGGDIRLGALLGLLVGGPLSAILLLFIASLGGTFFSLPFLINGKLKRNSSIPFGPFLVLGSIIVVLFGSIIIGWYKSHFISVN